MATVIDPVCGMQIETSQATAQTVYEGQAYFFGAEEGSGRFEENPMGYLGSPV